MSGLDVEALLDSTANASAAESRDTPRSTDNDDRLKNERSERRDRDRAKDGSRERDRKRRDRSRDRVRRDLDDDVEMKSPKSDRGSTTGSLRSKRRSKSRDSAAEKRHRRARDSIDRDDSYRSGGDFYRGSGRARSRSRSPYPDDDRHYRPTGRAGRRDDDRERERERGERGDRGGRDRERERGHGGRGGRHRNRSASAKRSSSPPLTEDERDRRTVFVQQLAARLRTKDLISFFEKVGPVKEAQIVKDRVSGRSKGYVYKGHCFQCSFADISTQSRIRRIQERGVCPARHPAYRPEANGYPHHRPAHGSREEPSSPHRRWKQWQQ